MFLKYIIQTINIIWNKSKIVVVTDLRSATKINPDSSFVNIEFSWLVKSIILFDYTTFKYQAFYDSIKKISK